MYDVAHLVETLQSVNDELGDLSMRILSDAISAGAQTRPSEEKKIAQARRSLDKAIGILSQLD